MLDFHNVEGSREITQIDIPDRIDSTIRRAISYVYYGANLVWQAVRSCFGSGIWISQKTWLSDETWKHYNK